MINNFKDAMPEASLKLFMQKLKEFENAIVGCISDESDFTVRFEVRGNKKEVVHVRVYTDALSKPDTK